jgi:hypothetical protein
MSAPGRLQGSRRAAWWRKLVVTATLEVPSFTATAILDMEDPCSEVCRGVPLVPGLRCHFRVSHGEYIGVLFACVYNCCTTQPWSLYRVGTPVRITCGALYMQPGQ